jgi:hypothetical protein
MNIGDKYIEDKYIEDKHFEYENNKILIIDNYITMNENENMSKNKTDIISINTKKKSKEDINIEFSNYIFKNCKYLLSNDHKKIIFNLQRIGNINKIFNNLENINKKIFKSLEYKIYRNKMIDILNKFIFLMLNKGFFCDFVNYNFILYELKSKNIKINSDDKSNNNSKDNSDNNNNEDEIYFIKMKYITNVNINENIIKNLNKNNIKSEGKTYIMFILHNNNLIYSMY